MLPRGYVANTGEQINSGWNASELDQLFRFQKIKFVETALSKSELIQKIDEYTCVFRRGSHQDTKIACVRGRPCKARLCAPTMTYSTPRELSNSRNSLQFLLRPMVWELHQNLKTFVTGKLFVEIAVRFVSLGETAKFLCRLFHNEHIDLAAMVSERI